MNRVLLALIALSACIRTSSAGEEPLRVLFIGNSYTYCNDLPGMVLSPRLSETASLGLCEM